MVTSKKIKVKTLQFRRMPSDALNTITRDQAMAYGDQAQANKHNCLAEYHFRQIVSAFPKEIEARHKLLELAMYFGRGEQFDALIAELEKLKVKRGDLLPILIDRALQEHDEELAMRYAQHLLQLKPHSADAHFMLGQVYSALGENQHAVAAYDKVISQSPRHVKPFYNRSVLLRQKINDEQRAQLDKALAGVNENDVVSFAYLTLAKAWSHYGDVDEEFHYLDKAKSRLAANDNVKSESFWAEFLRIAGFCTEERLKAAATIRDTEEAPVFIVAMGRSGTTLLESILGAHRDFVATGERSFLINAADRVGLSVSRNNAFWEWGHQFKLEDLLANFHQDISHHDVIKAAVGKRWIDKSLLNSYYMGLAKMIYPRAKFIHIKRNPMAVCLSNYQHFMGFSNLPQTLEQLAHHYRTIERAVEHWQTLFGDDILVMEYEQLTQDFEGQLRKMLTFLGADWDEDCLRFNEQSNVVLTPSSSAVRAQVNRDAEKRWMKYEKHLQPVAKVLNL